MLRSALQANKSDFAPIFDPPPAKAAEIAERLVERYGEGQEPRKSAAQLETLLGRLRSARFVWEKVAPADRLDVVWVLWSEAYLPAEHSAFLHDFLDWLETPNHRYQAMRLAIAWAAAFDSRLPSIRIVSDWLTSHLIWLPDPWRRLADRFQLFSVDGAPNALAEAFLRAETATARYFEAEGLPASAVRGGLGAEILAAAARQVKAQAAQPALALRLCDLALEIGAFEPADTPRVTARRSALQTSLAEALLLPWQFQASPPDAKASLLTFLLRHYGDMRVAPKRWRALCQPAVAVMHRWLIEETVATFFRLAGRSKSVERNKRTERQRFWLSRLDEIDSAWLLTGAHAAAEVAGEMAHGRLGGRPDHVALLLRIGNFTVLEMAHEASERVWLAGNPLAPALHQPPDHIYWPGSLARGVDFSSAHGEDGRLPWQARLAAFLER